MVPAISMTIEEVLKFIEQRDAIMNSEATADVKLAEFEAIKLELEKHVDRSA